jgi:hypothetical protein
MTKQTRTLARFSPTQLERFLVELANVQIDLVALRRIRERFADFIPPQNMGWLEKTAAKDKGFAKRLSELPSEVSLQEIEDGGWIVTLSQMLCNIWIEPDQRQKEWGLFAFRYALYKYEDESLTTEQLFGILMDPAKSFRIPPPAPFEQALSYLVKAGNKARYCANPDCPAPFFFVQRKNQRYCSEVCAGPAQRELKRKWWAEHGEEWRAARQSKKPGKVKSDKGKSGGRSKPTIKKGRKGK